MRLLGATNNRPRVVYPPYVLEESGITRRAEGLLNPETGQEIGDHLCYHLGSGRLCPGLGDPEGMVASLDDVKLGAGPQSGKTLFKNTQVAEGVAGSLDEKAGDADLGPVLDPWIRGVARAVKGVAKKNEPDQVRALGSQHRRHSSTVASAPGYPRTTEDRLHFVQLGLETRDACQRFRGPLARPSIGKVESNYPMAMRCDGFGERN